MERKALERLVSALLDEDLKISRLDAIENALGLALVALEGDDEFSEEDSARVESSLFLLAVQTLTQRMDDDDSCVYRVSYQEGEEDEVAEFLITTDKMLSGIMDHHIDKMLEPVSPYDVH